MFSASVIITAGALIAGVQAYRENQIDIPFCKILAKDNSVRLANAPSALPAEDNDHLASQSMLAGPDTRREQHLALSPHGKLVGISGAEKKIDRYLTYSMISLALSAAGSLLYAPLGLLSVPILGCLAYINTRTAFQTGFKSKRIGVGLIDFMGTVGPLVTGHFFASSLVFSLYFLSRKLLIKTEDHSRNSLVNVFENKPSFVWIEANGIEVEVPFERIQMGDVVLVSAGQTVPVDGKIVQGHGRIDQRILTGESQPVDKGIGESVLASTIVLEGKVGIKVEKAIQSRGETIINRGAIPTLAFSVLALPFLGIQGALAVLYASFGYQMRISAPLSVLNYLQIASEKGILIKDGRSLELLSKVDTFVFDKTGTLTEEVPTVDAIYLCHGYDENEILALAAAAEEKQNHPIALAICQEAQTRKLMIPTISDARYDVGYGLKVRLEEAFIRVGSRRFMEMESIAIPAEIQYLEEMADAQGHSLVYVAIDNQLGGIVELCATIRPEVRNLSHELRKRKMSLIIISGDSEGPTQKLASELGIERYFFQVLPQDKASLVEQLQAEGKSVCFVGDGINDSIALKKANISISLQGASTAATDSASIVLMDESLNQLIPLLDIAQDLDTNLKQSTAMTVIPGLICVAGVFFLNFGIVTSILLYNIALISSALNAMLPLFKHQRAKFEDNQSNPGSFQGWGRLLSDGKVS